VPSGGMVSEYWTASIIGRGTNCNSNGLLMTIDLFALRSDGHRNGYMAGQEHTIRIGEWQSYNDRATGIMETDALA